MLRICRGLWGCSVLWGLGSGLPAMADEAPAAPKANESAKLNYVLGAIVSSGPDYVVAMAVRCMCARRGRSNMGGFA